MTDHIEITRPEAHPGVLVLRFNRPDKKNAITQAMYEKLTAGLLEGENDEAIRAIVFLGAEGCFSAGNDMADFLSFAMAGAVGEPAAFGLLKALTEVTKPLVSGVDGLAIGIGTTLHMHCDLTVASDRSLFKTPFVDLALVPEAASSLIAPRIMGHQRAFAMLAASEGFSAVEAREAGLIWKVVPPDQVEAETLKLASSLASKPPAAMKIARALVKGSADEVRARMQEELQHFVSQLKSAEARAAFEAFMMKR
ncbi:MAG: crotonase/enoyl-CoA hydratase family protein [Rhizobiales bacterium]|nr:crotonase/enoyl-CoA hydratase family protein [Hyphomicrobiales bacterium]